VHFDPHIVDHAHDIFDLLGLDDALWQMVVDLGVGQIALLLASRYQLLQL